MKFPSVKEILARSRARYPQPAASVPATATAPRPSLFAKAAAIATGADAKAAEFARAAFSAAGLDFADAQRRGDSMVIAAKLAARAADVKSALAKTTDLSAQLLSVTGELTAMRAAFASVGVKLPVATAGQPPQAAEIAAAIKDRASIMASEQLGKHGLAAPLPLAPSVDSLMPGAASAAGLTGLARTAAAFKAQREAARAG